MRVLVTGSAGHLGEALMRTLRARGRDAVGLDLKASAFTDAVGSISNRSLVESAMEGIGAVLHAATLHKPHLATHTKQDFIETNLSGTLNLLEAASRGGARALIFTSTTSVFGHALTPPEGAPPAWVTEDVAPIPKNIYGVTKLAAEDLCALFSRERGLPCLALRTARFFPEEDDQREVREGFDGLNTKVNELLHRRLDLEDAVEAHLLALERAPALGFGRYILSATTPFSRDHLTGLRFDLPGVLRRLIPEYEEEYSRRGWKLFPSIDRVYVNERARADLGWAPRYDFRSVLGQLARADEPFSPLSRAVGSKGYHARRFEDGPYPVA